MYNAIRFKFETINLEEISKKSNIKLSILKNKINKIELGIYPKNLEN